MPNRPDVSMTKLECVRCQGVAEGRELRCSRPDKKLDDGQPEFMQGFFCEYCWRWAQAHYCQFDAVEHLEKTEVNDTWKQAYYEEAKKFQAETLRASELQAAFDALAKERDGLKAKLADVLKPCSWEEYNAEREALRQANAQRDRLQAEVDRMRAENVALRDGLRFYADGHHYDGDLFKDFESVSGEPNNFLCGQVGEDLSKEAVVILIEGAMVENGGVARGYLNDPIKAKKFNDEEDAAENPDRLSVNDNGGKVCGECGGRGLTSDKPQDICERCDGSGIIGFDAIGRGEEECPLCQGSGRGPACAKEKP